MHADEREDAYQKLADKYNEEAAKAEARRQER